MPIRFVDATAKIGRVQATLANASPAIVGTHTIPAGRTGSIGPQLQPHVGTFSGQFQANANRIGTLGSTLQNSLSSILGSSQAPSSSGFTPANATFSGTGATSHGQLFTVSRSSGSFGTHGDDNPSNYTWNGKNHLLALFMDFEDGQLEKRGMGYNLDGGVPDSLSTKWAISTSAPTNLTRSARRFYAGAEQGGLQWFPPQTPSAAWYVTFKFMITRPRRAGKGWRGYGTPSANTIFLATGSVGDPSWTEIENYGIRGGSDNGSFSTQYGGSGPALQHQAWNRIEIYFNGTTNMSVWLNGAQPWSTSTGFIPVAVGHTCDIGHMIDSAGRNPSAPSGLAEEYYADVVYSYTRNRFEIGATSTWSTARATAEIQVPTSWSTNTCTFAINRGAHDSLTGKYLFHVDTNDSATLIGQFT